MRLRRLDLARYGCFTDVPIDFGERDASKPDLHVIYGPNEAGKSTLFAAILDLMFGIERRSPYGFLHHYRAMRIGALVEIAGRTHALARIKRDHDSLLGPGDQPAPEAVLTSVLSSINRASYTTRFSLDDDTLQSGGESILDSGGDLGQLLFSATSGLSELSRQLDGIKTSADRFHRPGRHNTELRQLKDRLADLKSRRRDLDTNARRYAELVEKMKLARDAHQAAKTERDQARVRFDQVRRLLDALPMWANLKDLRGKLAPLQELPDPPAGWAERAQQLVRDESTRNAEIKGANEDSARLAGELDGIVVDDRVLGLQGRIDRLKEEEARYRAAEDIPNRERERRSVNERIVGLVERLGRPTSDDPAALLLPAATAGALDDLIKKLSGLLTRHALACGERDAAGEQVDQAREVLEGLGASVDVTGLQSILGATRAQELGARLALAQKREAELTDKIAADLIGLQPWRGDIAALAALAPPEPGRIERWKTDMAEVHDEQAAQSRKQAELVEERARLAAEIAAMKESSGVVDDNQAATARAARDRAWRAHRTLLDASASDTGSIDGRDLRSTADAFEAAMAEDDRLADLRARQAADIARLRLAGERIARTAASLLHMERSLETVRARRTALRVEIAKALQPIGLPSDMAPVDIERWRERREAILKMRMELHSAKAEMNAAAEASAEARRRLAEAITATGVAPQGDPQLAQLLDLAQGVVDQAKERGAEISAARKALRDGERDLKRRVGKAKEADQEVRRRREEWNNLLDGCWLGGTERDEPEVHAILQLLSDLPALIEKRDDLDRRIRLMRRDQTRFAATVRDLAGAAGMAFDGNAVLELADGLRGALADAREKNNLRNSKKADLERAQTREREARRAIAKIDDQRSEMADLFGVDTLPDLIQKLAQAKEKMDLAERIATRETELVEALKQSSLSAAETALGDAASDEASIDALRAERVELESRLAAEDERVTQLFHETMTAEAAIDKVGGDAEAARLEEERCTALLEIQDQAERHLRLKVGVAAAERALRIYRDRHRSSMMRRASDAFSTITRNRFSGLTTMPGKDGEILVGVQSTGGSLIASEMSKGTRFPLYLALRIAGYFEFAERQETLPFVADDIMETFDDDRSAETFRLLSGMAEKGQVIYLTHHRHMRDIALKVCGERVQAHELPPPPTGKPESAAASGG